MKHSCSRVRHGSGLIYAGTIVFLVGLTIVLFREFEIPRYWCTAVIGLLLITAGVVSRSLRHVCGRTETPDLNSKA